jgi:phage shock protein A
MSQLTPPGDVPTLAQVRDKVEQRYAVSLGRHELASQGVEARMLEIRKASLDAKASRRLTEIRTALSAGSGPGTQPPADQLPADKAPPGQLES